MEGKAPKADRSLIDAHFGDAARYAEFIQHFLATLRRLPPDRDSATAFLAFCAPLARRAKGQTFQDLWALWESGGATGGYFVEFGASDGVSSSNTWLLETEFWWHGVVAEPNPYLARKARKRRRCFVSDRCVHARSGERVAFLTASDLGLSRLKDVVPDDAHETGGGRTFTDEITVETISLNDLLTEAGAPREIDFMSVDTEGSEHLILSAFDFDRWRVKALCVEHNFTPARDALFRLLDANGFRRKWPELSGHDDWYVRGDD